MKKRARDMHSQVAEQKQQMARKLTKQMFSLAVMRDTTHPVQTYGSVILDDPGRSMEHLKMSCISW